MLRKIFCGRGLLL
jgi:hypothetical protein